MTLPSPRVWLLLVAIAGACPPARGADEVSSVQFVQPLQSHSEPELRQPPAEQGVTLETALQWTLMGNPDLVAARQNLDVSAAALEVARRFPTSLNPTVSLDTRPWVFERVNGQVERLENDVTVSISQPIELGHRTAYRTSIARSEYSQTESNVMQIELTALIQTYRLHQTASYRREKLQLARELNEYSTRLVQTMRRQWEANQVPAGDAALAEVEYQTALQQVDIAGQDYLAALTDLRQQLGLPEHAAVVEPTGAPHLPPLSVADNEEALVQSALNDRPEIRAAEAKVEASRTAICLARADRIPVFSAGSVYEKNESGASFYGVVFSSPVPILNGGMPLVRQREAEYRRDVTALEQLRTKTAAQVKAALVKWKQTRQFVDATAARAAPVKAQVERMQHLFEAGQTDVMKLLQVRQRLVDAQGAQLDAVWQATQAYADLLTAVGTGPLLNSAAKQPEMLPLPPSPD